MVEAGADQVPEDDAPRGARPRPARDRRSSARRRRSSAPAPASRSGSTGRDRASSRPQYGDEISARMQAGGPPRRPPRSSRRSSRARAAPLTMELDRGGRRSRELQARMSLSPILEKKRSAAVEAPVRAAVRGRPARAHRGRAGLEGAEVARSSTCSSTGSSRRSSCRSRSARAGGEPGRQGHADQGLRPEGGRGDLQGPRPQEDRGREAAPRRPLRDEIRPITCEVSVSPRTHGSGLFTRGQTQIMSLAHARHRQGGAADRRPLAREGPPVHAPLQLPAVLGRARPGG